MASCLPHVDVEVDLDLCFETAVYLAEEAGKVIRKAIDLDKNIQTKASYADLVTETDKEVEELLINGFKSKFPNHKFIGEESTSAGVKSELTDAPTWIIDPVDGTMNFVHRFPNVAVSIGLAVNQKVVIGVVYNPVLDKMYTARRGQGSFCNGKRLRVSRTEELNEALLVLEIGSLRTPEMVDLLFTNFTNLVTKLHGVRAMGSAALDMCTVASGEADAYFEFGIHCWDMAAGMIIVQEAGGVVMDTEGGPLDIMERRVLCASCSKLAEALSKELKHIRLERD